MRSSINIPNTLSFGRLLGIPLFLWLISQHADAWALLVLMLSGVTDWADGYLARKLNQRTELGAILDPIADRLYILAVLVGLVWRDIVPWWAAGLIVLRDVLLWCLFPILRRNGHAALPVHLLGKAATFNLLYAFPLLFLTQETSSIGQFAKVFGWAFAIWGFGLYWWTGIIYLRQTLALTNQEVVLAKSRRLE